ncbi:MAG TPA: response regulator transcription factor [Actinomycetota bacterium]
MSDRLRVVIAEDHYLVREGTRGLLESSGEVEVAAAVEDAPSLLDAVERLHPDVVLVDIRMPPTHQTEGIDAARRIRAAHPEVGVVVLSQHVSSHYAFELFRDGTSGLAYLLKDRVGDLDELLAALRSVADGGSVIDPLVVERLLAQGERLSGTGLSELSPREMEVLAKMAEGKSNTAIAGALFVSQSAVEKHINSIFAKLGLSVDEGETHRRVAAVLAFLRSRDQSRETQG